MFEPVLYISFTAYPPITSVTTLATFQNDTKILAIHKEAVTASRLLHHHFNEVDKRMKICQIKANISKFIYVTFIFKQDTCPSL